MVDLGSHSISLPSLMTASLFHIFVCVRTREGLTLEQFGRMGQTLDLVFLGPEKLEPNDLRERLAELGLKVKRASSVFDWVEWTSHSRKPIILAANVHHGLWDQYWAQLSLDSRTLRAFETTESRRSLVNDFLDLGKRLWALHPFYEGSLAAEEGGVLVSGKTKEQFQDILRKMRTEEVLGSSYANFLGDQAARKVQLEQWVYGLYAKASIQQIPRNGALIVWDATPEGFEKYLSAEF